MSKVTGAHTVLNALIDVDTGQDPMTRTESFERWLGDYASGDNASILDILAMKNLWEGGGKPFIKDVNVNRRASFKNDKRKQPLFYSIASLLGDEEYPVDTLKVASLSKRNEPFNIRHSVRQGLTSTGTLLDDFIAEMSHAYTYKDFDLPLMKDRNILWNIGLLEEEKYGENVYDIPGFEEYEAHTIMEPYLKYILEEHGGVLDQGWREYLPFMKKPSAQLAKEFSKSKKYEEYNKYDMPEKWRREY